MTASLRTIAVDLTPVLPGGENGGAKIFVLELLRGLAENAPDTQFVLLTQSASHAELAVLDRRNVRRLLVAGATVTTSMRPRIKGIAARVLPHVPRRARMFLSRFAYDVNGWLKRGTRQTLLRGMRVDLLFCPFTAPIYHEPGIPTVCTIYDLQYRTFPDFFTPEDAAQRDRTFTEACRRSAALAAISDYARDSAILHGKLDATHIRTIHLRMARRVDVAHDAAHALAPLALTSRRYVIYPANFWMHKNHEMLITAFGMACRGGLAGDVKLVCTGSPGPRMDWLRNAAQRLRLGDRIIFPGFVSHADLVDLLNNAGAMVFPSLYEGFGLPVVEAMSAGVPVACSNTTSLPEVAGDAAIFFDPRVPDQIAHAIVALMGDRALQERLRDAGRRRADGFADTGRMVQEYWELFGYALSNQRRENLVTGVYADGWASPLVEVVVEAGAAGRRLEVEFFAPDWLPVNLIIRATRQSAEAVNLPDLKLAKGQSALWSASVDTDGAHFEIRVGPVFVPSASGDGDDARELAALVRRCHVVEPDGRTVDLLDMQAAT